jgi:nanoRNase/pAp phosphatase (c-di-AMP/oligoRNAs hydrolase)
MQIKSESYTLLHSLINQVNRILIWTKDNPDGDCLAAGLALKSMLMDMGKMVDVIAQGSLPADFASYSSQIRKGLGQKKLIVSFDWQKNEIDKVSYNMEGERFNFIISPKGRPIDPTEVKVTSQGENYEVVFTIGISSLDEVKDDDRQLLIDAVLINIDKDGQSDSFGRLNFVDPTAESLCTIIAKIAQGSDLPLSQQAKQFILFGLRAATDNFSSVKDASSFEAAAFVTRGNEKEQGTKILEDSKEASAPTDWYSPKVFRSKQSS